MKGILAACLLLCAQFGFSYGWIQKADFGGEARHRTPMLSIGNCIYTGQGHYNGAGINILFNDWWQYDPATNAWTQKANYAGGAVYHASGFVINDIGYVGCGRTQPGGPGNPYVHENDFYKYEPATNTWTQIASMPGQGRRGAVSFAIGDYGFVGTGETLGGSMLNDFYRYNSLNNTWSVIASIPTPGRVSAVGFELNGYGYVGTGGLSSWSSSSNDFWRYNPTTNQWNQMADVGPTNRMEAAGFSINGKGYILTGDNYSSGDNYSDMWEYDPAANQWIQIPEFPGSARRYLAVATHNGVAYCGLGTNGTNFKDFWMFDQVMALIEQDLDKVNIIAGPNPAWDHIRISITGLKDELAGQCKLKVYSPTGHEVFCGTPEDNQLIVNTIGFAKSLYIYSLEYKDRQLKTGKFMVQ